MEIEKAIEILRSGGRTGFDFYERREGKYQLILPILHEDGDMVDIYLENSPNGEDRVRICDFGMTMMRLSYNFEVGNSATRRRIFESILINNGVKFDKGNIYLDTPLNLLYEGVLQFAGCVQKVSNMRYWSRETIRSTFYEDLREYTTTKLERFNPVPNKSPLPDYEVITVDWALTYNNRNLYLFGVPGNDKAKSVAVSLLEFEKAKLPFISFVVHEDMEGLGMKERQYLTRNADIQYPNLEGFRERADGDIRRIAA